MSASHGHAHGYSPARPHDRPGARHRRRLAIAVGLVASFFAVELVAGLLSGSLALLSDAGHMAADVTALGAALLAIRVAGRPDRTGRRTYGSYRVEILASGLTVLIMLGVAVYVVVEAVRRLGPQLAGESGVASTAMLVVGGLGLVVNLVGLVLLRRGAGESLTVKGAYLEVLADTAGSVGVVVAGVLVLTTGQAWWDTAVALAIGSFVAARAVLLAREVLAVLGQHAPAGMDPHEVAADLEALDAVTEVHDLHLWTLTSGMHVATSHLVTPEGADTHAVLDAARDVLRDRHGIDHATLQVEPVSHVGCKEVGW